MPAETAKLTITFKVEEKQQVFLISPEGFLPPWAVGKGVLFLDTNVTDKLVSGSKNKVTAWSTGWLMDHASDYYLLSPVFWAYEQAYRRKNPAAAFLENMAKASQAFLSHGYVTFSHDKITPEALFATIDDVVKPTAQQRRWLQLCVDAKRTARKVGRKEAVLAAAVEARDNFAATNLGLALFVGLLVVAGHHPSWRLIKGAPSYTPKAASNALLDLNAYLAYLLFRDTLVKNSKEKAANHFSVWFATADKPLAHVMLNGACVASIGDGHAHVHFTLGNVLRKELHPESLAGFDEALQLLDESEQ